MRQPDEYFVIAKQIILETGKSVHLCNVLAGVIMGMENSGAIFLEHKDDDVFFAIKQGSLSDNLEGLARATMVFREMFGLTLKVK